MSPARGAEGTGGPGPGGPGPAPVLIDTHAHLDSGRFRSDLEGVLERAFRAGVARIVTVGADEPSSRRAVEIAARHPGVFATVGVHPHEAARWGPRSAEALEALVSEGPVVAVGEAGLDFYRDLSPRPVQERVFREQVRLARRLGLPLVVHDRDAHDDVLRILAEERAGETAPVVMHCFSGGPALAQVCAQRGYYLSVAGPVTFANARRTLDTARAIPLERLLLETDCPYLAPEPHRGGRNEPAFLVEVARRVAELWGLELWELARLTTQNACRAFGLPQP
ncbi:MAG: TatD family hydrolase [Acetobacteraceae bacterium]|nr:TatD family hydrolase [Acetobacteraceae bacterium]